MNADFRGSSAFVLYLITDSCPEYQWRATVRGLRIVNTNMFELKQKVREMIPNRLSIHCTDNIQETKDNLRALGLDRFYEHRAFPNLSMALQALNQATQHGFYYVVMRNFESYPDKVTIDEHLDVDILCSDYFAAKRI